MEIITVSEAKKNIAHLINRVVYSKEQFIITQKGKMLAKLVPAGEAVEHLASAAGWLDQDDDFFYLIEDIVDSRRHHLPRTMNQDGQ